MLKGKEDIPARWLVRLGFEGDGPTVCTPLSYLSPTSYQHRQYVSTSWQYAAPYARVS